ncbi:uncharacterized protein BDZ99DRAFT_569613 [Mytilinidion resinicola]|uniref:Uncharacterized protein n=1 Tax=Mytilinidion resinicola TaxID=574789 RepID=A0A6A6YRQ1_9PEZI|nr:uncharacterized protein BDZ99DRAFT_569613 [Mytilinidion resinicola]KAF2811616.1 hypothetical protein BDZ99DRAFT_569613 [Mytilinidion resinicola]
MNWLVLPKLRWRTIRQMNETLNKVNGLLDMMKSIATKMTDVVRNSRGQSADNYFTQTIGSATQLDIYVHVRWAWLTVPFVLVAASLTFMLLTMAYTADRDVQTWKSSSLAVLAHGLEDDAKSLLLQNGNSLGGMGKLADRLNVQLLAEKGSLSLVRTVAG